MKIRNTLIAFGSLGCILLATAAASAADFEARSTLEHVGKQSVEVPEEGVQAMFHGVMTGSVTSESTPVLSGAEDWKSWTAVVPADGEAIVVGHEAFRATNGSVLHIRFVGIPSSAGEDGNGSGSWEVVGGTGVFEDATGQGEYTYIPNDTGGLKIFEGALTLENMRTATE